MCVLQPQGRDRTSGEDLGPLRPGGADAGNPEGVWDTCAKEASIRGCMQHTQATAIS